MLSEYSQYEPPKCTKGKPCSSCVPYLTQFTHWLLKKYAQIISQSSQWMTRKCIKYKDEKLPGIVQNARKVVQMVSCYGKKQVLNAKEYVTPHREQRLCEVSACGLIALVGAALLASFVVLTLRNNICNRIQSRRR